jgi:type II secretory ATPase GspE/PulE/Tfp pilus assembly ATPase PilB-like protein
VHVRISIMPTVHGEKAVLRLLGCEGLRPIEALGFDERALSFISAFCGRADGAALLAGPTGSGKTTTMYAIMQRLQSRNLSLISIEDPVEIRLDGVSQTSVNEQLGLTYAHCLRSVLRQDPDVILLGEIRDEESARIAFQAALTGHLLLATVHARSVAEVFLRLRSLQLDDLSIAQGVNLLVCQRLLPRLCEHCKVIDLANANMLEHNVYQPVGCRRCDYSGFEGRVLAAEALEIEPALSKKLASGAISFGDVSRHTPDKNYSPMLRSLEKLLRAGKISMDQFLSLCALEE